MACSVFRSKPAAEAAARRPSSSPSSTTLGSSDETSSAETSASAAPNGRICTQPYWPTMASAAILTIGNELLSGDIENTNGSWLARRLEIAGVEVRLIAVVPDEIDEIATTLREQADRTDLVVVTGGLRRTPDSRTC